MEDLARFSDEGARIIVSSNMKKIEIKRNKINFQRKRLEGRNKELEQQINKLQDELGKREKREKVYSLFVIVVVSYTFLVVIRGILY